MTAEHLLIIDGHNLYLRAYAGSPLVGSDGQRVGGYITSFKSIGKMLNEFRPQRIVVCWDGEGGSQRRRSIFGEYKAGRKVRINRGDNAELDGDAQADLENMRWQLSLLMEHLTLLGVPQVRAAGVEADDLMSYLARDAWSGRVTLVTTDQDILQLVERDRVQVYSPIKKLLFTHDLFVQTYGIIPENYRLMKALCGDSSDNIPGIRGFGPKTVVKHFPFLKERLSDATEILSAAREVVGQEPMARNVPKVLVTLLEGEARFRENMELMDLGCPMMSAQAALSATAALDASMPCREFEFKVAMMRSGVTSNDERLTLPFKDQARRRAFSTKGDGRVTG